MCEHGKTRPVALANGTLVDVDQCLASLVEVLNANGIPTVASCCGHGWQPASIVLEGDVELRLFSFEQARALDKLVGRDIHGQAMQPAKPPQRKLDQQWSVDVEDI